MTWATSVSILVFLNLSVSILELGTMYATDRRQTKASLNASALCGHNNHCYVMRTLNLHDFSAVCLGLRTSEYS